MVAAVGWDIVGWTLIGTGVALALLVIGRKVYRWWHQG